MEESCPQGLCTSPREEDHAIKNCLSTRGLPTNRETISLYSSINDGHRKRLEQGLTTRDRLRVERFSDFFRAVGYEGDPVVMADDYVEALSRQTQPVEGALELIASLHGRCGLYSVTNEAAILSRYLEKVDKFFPIVRHTLRRT